jgi:hypothetical protein
VVHVYNLDPSGALPYDRTELDAAWTLLPDQPMRIDPPTAARWSRLLIMLMTN